jgi:hypothetical protein
LDYEEILKKEEASKPAGPTPEEIHKYGQFLAARFEKSYKKITWSDKNFTIDMLKVNINFPYDFKSILCTDKNTLQTISSQVKFHILLKERSNTCIKNTTTRLNKFQIS